MHLRPEISLLGSFSCLAHIHSKQLQPKMKAQRAKRKPSAEPLFSRGQRNEERDYAIKEMRNMYYYCYCYYYYYFCPTAFLNYFFSPRFLRRVNKLSRIRFARHLFTNIHSTHACMGRTKCYNIHSPLGYCGYTELIVG